MFNKVLGVSNIVNECLLGYGMCVSVLTCCDSRFDKCTVKYYK